MSERPLPSIWRMLWVDFPSFTAAAFPLAVLGLGMTLALFGGIPGLLGRDSLGPDDLPGFLAFGALTLALCLPLLWLRIRHLRGLLRRGRETRGTILRSRRARNGSRLTYRYRFEDRPYERTMLTPSWQDELEADSPVTVILDPEHPGRSLIKELYY
jgi:hypothetical protein